MNGGEIATALLCVGIIGGGIARAIDAWRNPYQFADYHRRKHQDRDDRYKGMDELLSVAQTDLAMRRQALDKLGMDIDRLTQEKTKTRKEVFGLIDGLANFGLIAHNRRKYIFDLCLFFLLGIAASLVASLLYKYFLG